MKSSDIKVLTVKNKYDFSGNENEILTKQFANLKRKPLIYSNNHNNTEKNFFNDNSFFLDDYEIINTPINIEKKQDSLKNTNIGKFTSFPNEIKIGDPAKLAKIIQKHPIFPLKNDDNFYVSPNTLMQNNNHQLNCTNCLAHLPNNSRLPLFYKTGNDKYDKKIEKISAKTNYCRARYEQLRIKKQLQVDWKYCSKHIITNCQFAHQNKHNFEKTQVNDLSNFDQQHNQLILEHAQNEMLDIKSTLINSDETKQIKTNVKEDFNFAELDDFDVFSQDFDDLPKQKTEEIDFDDDEFDLLTQSSESEEKQNVSDSLLNNNEQNKINKLQINFVETNPNEKPKSKLKYKLEKNLVDKIKLQDKQVKVEDDFDFDDDLFADFDDNIESLSNHVESNLTIDPVLLGKQQSISNHNKRLKLHKTNNQSKKAINFATNRVITWNNFLNLSLKITLVVIIILAICLGLLFKQQINISNTHWNILWLLNKSNYSQKSIWLSFIYNNIFLITSLLYSFFFVVPLIIFGRKKMFIISLATFMTGLVIWTVFACLGFFKYGSFKINKIIASLETTSLIVSWLVFTLFLSKLIKYNKQVKNK